MKELYLGIVPLSELADWFNIKPKSLTNSKVKKLKELEDFCAFEDLGRRGVKITEIYLPVYTKLMKDVEVYKQMVEKQPEHLTSISAMTKELKKTKEYNDLSEKAIEYRMAKAGTVGFGITKEENSRGVYGSREYIWAIKLEGPVYYRYFSEEEKQLFDELTVGLYSSNPDKIQKAALLDESLKKGEMTTEEWSEKKDALGLNVFSEVLYKFREKTGLIVVRATKHQIENNFE